jgi:endoglucanase
MKIKENYRKVFLIAFAIFLGLFYSCNTSNTTDTTDSNGFEIKRGVNLSHWLSQDFGWVPKYALINENDIKFIDSIGYDHVRIPIDEQELWDENGEPIQEGFNSLLNCLNWCDKYNLRAIVDLHIIRSHHFNTANEGGSNTLWVDTAAQNSFINLWAQLSIALHKYPVNMVAYELLNEVVAPEHDDWNKLLNRAIAVIREKEPNRVIVVGPNMWQIAPNLQYLKLPENDRNIILSFHTYNPLAFTHYKASWTPAGDFPGKVTYPGQIISDEDYKKYIDTTNAGMVNAFADARDNFNKERIVAGFESGIKFAKSKNFQLYCGEFGCLPTVDRNERLTYYSDMISAFEENNIAWCNWEYKGDFGIFKFDTVNKVSLSPDYELIDILLQKK